MKYAPIVSEDEVEEGMMERNLQDDDDDEDEVDEGEELDLEAVIKELEEELEEAESLETTKKNLLTRKKLLKVMMKKKKLTKKSLTKTKKKTLRNNLPHLESVKVLVLNRLLHLMKKILVRVKPTNQLKLFRVSLMNIRKTLSF